MIGASEGGPDGQGAGSLEDGEDRHTGRQHAALQAPRNVPARPMAGLFLARRRVPRLGPRRPRIHRHVDHGHRLQHARLRPPGSRRRGAPHRRPRQHGHAQCARGGRARAEADRAPSMGRHGALCTLGRRSQCHLDPHRPRRQRPRRRGALRLSRLARLVSRQQSRRRPAISPATCSPASIRTAFHNRCAARCSRSPTTTRRARDAGRHRRRSASSRWRSRATIRPDAGLPDARAQARDRATASS